MWTVLYVVQFELLVVVCGAIWYVCGAIWLSCSEFNSKTLFQHNWHGGDSKIDGCCNIASVTFTNALVPTHKTDELGLEESQTQCPKLSTGCWVPDARWTFVCVILDNIQKQIVSDVILWKLSTFYQLEKIHPSLQLLSMVVRKCNGFQQLNHTGYYWLYLFIMFSVTLGSHRSIGRYHMEIGDVAIVHVAGILWMAEAFCNCPRGLFASSRERRA